jgi:hypothetical protein
MDDICVEVMTDLATYFSDDWIASTLYAAKGRLIPFNSNSPTGSTVTAFSTFDLAVSPRLPLVKFWNCTSSTRGSVHSPSLQ